ncbi:hypothetical protein TNCV_4491861 [Trichonephila clavipes]|nr:hypothetical protein TNCV_4491861 [Trichonephila clavipes]
MLLSEVESLKLEESRSVTSVAASSNCSQHRCHDHLETISNYRNSYPGLSSGRPRGITPANDRYIVLQARRNRRQTAGEIARHTHRRLDDRYRVLPWPEDCTVVVCLHDALYGAYH